MYRTVRLPHDIAGRLFLGSMPGRYEVFEEAWRAIVEHGVTRVICLVPPDELQDKSPRYARALREKQVPWVHESFPVEDFEAPADREAFWTLARETAARLGAGETVLAHCAAGIGRTGTFAVCVLLALGLTAATARAAVRSAGAGPQTSAQEDVVHWAAQLDPPCEILPSRSRSWYRWANVAVRGGNEDEQHHTASQLRQVDRRSPPSAQAAGGQPGGLQGHRVHGHGGGRPQYPQGLPRGRGRGVLLPARGRHDPPHHGGRRPRDIPIRAGEIFLLPPKVPHSPQRKADTVGLVIERQRREGELDRFQWYCDDCHAKIYEESVQLTDIVAQLPPIFERFWKNEANRKCDGCGSVMEPVN